MIGITGAAGFLGSHLLDALAGSGRPVRGNDVRSDARGLPREGWQRLQRWGEQIERVPGDLRADGVAARFCDGLSLVYHAARPSRHLADPIDVAVASTRALLEAMDAARVHHLVLISSGEVYGDTPPQGAGPHRAPAPRSRWAAALVACEALAHAWRADDERRQLTLVRPFTVYGPRMAPDHVVHRFLSAALHRRPATYFGDGHALDDYVFASDFVRVVAQAGRAHSDGRATIVHVASGRGTTLHELLGAVRRVTGALPSVEIAPERPSDLRCSVGDPEHTWSQLHVRPTVGLDEGLQRTVAWMAARAGAR